jgi:predicted ATPase/transcriptional regulator with XRE-family HTH domain
MDDHPTLGQRVHRLRVALGLSQQQLAERARLRQASISQIEHDRRVRPLSARTLIDLADALGVELEALVAGDPRYEGLAGVASASVPSLPAGLPIPTSPLVGREAILSGLEALFRDDGSRLVTLTGPGGVGKSHLALRAASNVATAFADGLAVVSLAARGDLAAVVSAVAHATGVRERDSRPLMTRLTETLRPQHRLLLLDNAEQARVAVAAFASEALAACPRLHLVVTSRAALRVCGEREVQVAPLACPAADLAPSVAEVAVAPAVQLFVKRVRAIEPRFALTPANAADVAAICRRLDGLPLAIELAAARFKLFSPAELRRRLGEGLTVLSGGARDLPVRQQTLDGAIAWSYDLLTPGQQTLLRRLSVFVAGFGPDDSSLPSVLPDVLALHELNLLTRIERPAESLRFGMLDTVRSFAGQRLRQAGEEADANRRLLAWAVTFAERAERNLFGPAESHWLDQLDLERQNLLAALSWALDQGEIEEGTRLAVALTDYWYIRGDLGEGRLWLDRALALGPAAKGQGASVARVRALAGASQLAQPHGDLVTAVVRAEQSMELAHQLGDRVGFARANALLGNLAYVQGELVPAESLHRAALALFRFLGDLPWTVVELNNLGLLALERDDGTRAAELAREALEVARGRGDTWGAGIALRTIGDAALLAGDLAAAAARYADSLALAQQHGSRWGVANSLAAFASLALARGEPLRAARLFACAQATYESLGIQLPPKLRPDWTRNLARAREDAGAERFAAAWLAGRALTLERAIADAVAMTRESSLAMG